MLNFEGKNILVVGASSGIGYDLASQLSAHKAKVWSASRSKPQNIDTQHISLDVTRFDDDFAQSLPAVLHGIAYCPGSISLRPFNRLSEEDFLNDYRINVLGAVKTIQAALPALKKADGASIVLYSTVAVKTGLSFHASIAAAKGAVEGLAKSLAAELAPVKIRVNVVAPSLTDTPLAKNLLTTEEKREAAAKRHPLNRIGTSHDMAALSAFLLADQASWISGQVIGVDGGMSALRTF